MTEAEQEYVRELKDRLALQERIIARLVRELEGRLPAQESGRPVLRVRTKKTARLDRLISSG